MQVPLPRITEKLTPALGPRRSGHRGFRRSEAFRRCRRVGARRLRRRERRESWGQWQTLSEAEGKVLGNQFLAFSP
jgi:hypothetical protein